MPKGLMPNGWGRTPVIAKGFMAKPFVATEVVATDAGIPIPIPVKGRVVIGVATASPPPATIGGIMGGLTAGYGW